MATPITKEAVKAALGITEKTTPKTGSGLSLDSVSKGLEIIKNPLISKYLDRLGEYASKRFGLTGAVGQGGELPKAGPNINIQATVQPSEIYEMLYGFVHELDEKITMGEFKNWMIKEKDSLIGAIDRAIKSRAVVK